MAMNIWPTIKRLAFLEKASMADQSRIASLMADVDDLEQALMQARAERDFYARELGQTLALVEIENLCADIEGEG